MPVKTAGYLANTAANTERGPTEALWYAPGSPNAWIADFIQDPRLGMYFFDDFLTFPKLASGSLGPVAAGLGWGYFGTANAAVADDGIVGAGLKFSASTTASQGNNISSLTGAFQIINGSAALQGRLVFEARVRANGIANTQNDTFVGLMDNGGGTSGIPISGTPGTLSATPNLIGFHKRGGTTNATDWNFVYQLAGGTAVYPTNLQNLVNTVTGSAYVNSAYVKLGFVYNPNAVPILINTAVTAGTLVQTVGVISRPMIQVYVNGQPAAAFLNSANLTSAVSGAAFPTGFMGPVFAFYEAAASVGYDSAIDWIRVAQNAIT